TLRVGNPQCVVLGEVTALTDERLHHVAAKLAVHPIFPAGSNVELATVEAPDRVRILIWERGVGPTEASGTGACASAVAAMRYGGAARGGPAVSAGAGARRRTRSAGGLAGRVAARRMDRRRPVPHRLGGARRRGNDLLVPAALLAGGARNLLHDRHGAIELSAYFGERFRDRLEISRGYRRARFLQCLSRLRQRRPRGLQILRGY